MTEFTAAESSSAESNPAVPVLPMRASRLSRCSVEFQLACACCRPESSPDDEASLLALLRRVDVPAFVDLVVTRHRIGPMVWARLKRLPAASLPTGLMAPLEAEAGRNSLRALAAVRLTALIGQAFGAASIPYLMFKGATLAARYHAEPFMRHVNDLDVWVPPERLDDARAALASLGFRWDPTLTQWDLAARGPRHRAFLLRYHMEEVHRSAEHRHVELHWALTDNPRLFRLTPQDLLAAGDDLPVGGVPLRVMNHVDLLLYLCEHGGRHMWARLKWLADLPRVLRALEAAGQCNGAALLARAREAGCERSVLLGWRLAHELFGDEMPPEVAQACRAWSGSEALVGLAMEALAQPHGWQGDLSQAPRGWLLRLTMGRVHLAPDLPALLKTLRSTSLSAKDLRVIRLPDWAFGAYYLLRPALYLWRRLRWRWTHRQALQRPA